MTAEPEARELSLKVRHKSEIADGVFLFELAAEGGGELPPFTPGSHITVTTPSGQKRRYSLCNDPAEREHYLIAVKQETSGRGGSLSFTRDIKEGDLVSVEPPENQFEMAKSAPKRLIFIAGGIGITPIRAMILHCLRHGQTNFMLYYFTRTPAMMAFREEFASPAFDGKVVLHHDNGDPDQAYDLWPVLEQQRGAHLYCCGPRGLMDAVRDMTGHWPDSAVHFEDFVGASAPRADDKPFEVRLSKSGATYNVAAHVSILDTLRQHGHVLPSSCESGTCGTCRCKFIDGEPDHRDLVLSDEEKKREILICVSRAKSPTLTLDI
ncbi:MAG TPA: PDR/VanB family oxidoreductase [Bradyrhizobium sp.]|uniref:PDR/VanB family oxidoreductase n=1 Tax=Bradyrhizobium sp. TaxID=376 RepID=UPI002D7EC1DE|nr:PDR/VanB family oxidoreductase [Bradyrhizobium sp.]HET7887142.1 PDR/VanB family oxidoreductase [Bradyrhizobium sp.]